MLVDLNANVGHWPFQQLQYNTCEAMLDRMNRFGVDISIISNLNGVFYKNTQSANEELHQELRKNKRFDDTFIPFAVINPSYAGWKEDLQRSHKELGMKGVRLYPQYHDYAITDSSCVDLVKMARDLRMPIALTLRLVDHRQRSWLDIQHEGALRDVIPLIRLVPDAQYLILNVANGAQLGDEDAELIKRTEVLMDTSGRALNSLPDMIERYGKEKFGFGTHAPIHDYLTGLLRIESMRESDVDIDIKELLRWGNAKRFLKL